MSSLHHVFSFAAMVAVSGCATGVIPHEPDFAWPSTYDASLPSGLVPAELDDWWSLFADPELDRLVDRALGQGFDVRDAFARLEEARAVRSSALARYGPQGDLESNAEVRTTTDLEDSDIDGTTSRSDSVTFPLSWELDLFGRRASARQTADADLVGARFDYEGTRAALVAEVARSLFQARGLAVQVDDAKENVQLQQQLLDLLDRRVDRGLAASSEADRVAADVSVATAQVLTLEAELKAARRSLLVLVGDGLASLQQIVVTAELREPPAVPDRLPGDLLLRRPDIRQAQARIASEAGKVRSAELDFFPRLTLQSSVGLTTQRRKLDPSTGFWAFGIEASVPILDRARLGAALRAESARGQQAVVNYERIVQTAYAESDQALTQLQADRLRVETLAIGETRARRAQDAALKRFQLGFSGLQEVLDAKSAWRVTRIALTSARVDALLRSVQAFQALGGGWPSASDVSSLSEGG